MSSNTVFELEIMQYLERQQEMLHNRVSNYHKELSAKIDRMEKDIKKFKRIFEDDLK